MFAYQFRVTYDTTKLDLTEGDVRLGSEASGWQLTASVDDDAGLVDISAFSGTPLTGLDPELLVLDFSVDEVATGTAAIDIDTVTTTDQETPLSRLNEGLLELTGVDGSVTVTPGDTTPPAITQIILAGSGWNSTFIDGVDGDGVGSGNGLGMELSPGMHISNAGIDRIHLFFSEDIGSLSADQVELLGSDGAYAIDAIEYHDSTYVAVVHLDTTIGFDKLRLSREQ